jgi:hypothetical protein
MVAFNILSPWYPEHMQLLFFAVVAVSLMTIIELIKDGHRKAIDEQARQRRAVSDFLDMLARVREARGHAIAESVGAGR